MLLRYDPSNMLAWACSPCREAGTIQSPKTVLQHKAVCAFKSHCVTFIPLKVSSVLHSGAVQSNCEHSALQMRSSPDQVSRNNKRESEEVVFLFVFALSER